MRTSALTRAIAGAATVLALVGGSLYGEAPRSARAADTAHTAGSAAQVVSPEIEAEYQRLGGAAGPLGPLTNPLVWYPFNGGGQAQGYQNGPIYFKSGLGAFAVLGSVRNGYFAQGGAAGALGWPTGHASCSGQQCSQTFERGTIFANPATGAWAVSGPILTAYNAAGTSTWGWPFTPVIRIATTKGAGYGQAYTNGSAYVADGGSAYFVTGAIRDYYFSKGGATGTLGFPLSKQTCASSGRCEQTFQGGTVTWAPGTAAKVVSPEIEAEYQRLGGAAGPLGPLTNPLVWYPFNGGGQAQGYQNGPIYFKSGLGAFAVLGSVRNGYFAQGGAAGALGWPTGHASCSGQQCSQTFERGTIFANPATGAWAVSGPILTAYNAAGTSTWGWPFTPVIRIATTKGAGYGQAYTNGSAYVADGGSAYFVTGAIRDYYFNKGGATGTLGFPTGARQCGVDSVCTQTFQGGTIRSSPTAGVSLVGVVSPTCTIDVLVCTNLARAANGLAPLSANATLNASAQACAERMAASGTMTHSTTYPSGFSTWGENIAYGYTSASSVFNAWMNSTGHRANILKPAYTQMGIGYVAAGNWWCQQFGA